VLFVQLGVKHTGCFFEAKDGVMTTARRKTVNYDDTCWYHCISRIARGLDTLEKYDRVLKRRIERELSRLSKIFAIRVGGHAIMGTHFHFLLHAEVPKAKSWSSVEVIRRWALLCPPRNKKREVLRGEELQFWIDEKAKDKSFVEVLRERLLDLGWFHRFLKQPLSVFVNKLEACSGTLFQGRFKSIAVIGFEALLNVAIYIDLNPVAAGIVDVPEAAEYTSFRQRFENAIRSPVFTQMVERHQNCSLSEGDVLSIEESHWLLPIENRSDSQVATGMFDELTLVQYMILVDEAGRIPRVGKASISEKAAALLDRLGINHDIWVRQQQLLGAAQFRGHYFCGSREVLQRVAAREGKRYLMILNGCPC
jgi:hypothetical protein